MRNYAVAARGRSPPFADDVENQRAISWQGMQSGTRGKGLDSYIWRINIIPLGDILVALDNTRKMTHFVQRMPRNELAGSFPQFPFARLAKGSMFPTDGRAECMRLLLTGKIRVTPNNLDFCPKSFPNNIDFCPKFPPNNLEFCPEYIIVCLFADEVDPILCSKG